MESNKLKKLKMELQSRIKKFKKLEIDREIISIIIWNLSLVGCLGGCGAYYLYENQEQVCETELNPDSIFVDEDGQVNCYFEAGEHIIVISNNDALYRKSEEIEGYTIKEVEVNGWRDNNRITYVNTKPVIAVATVDEDGKLRFDDFGVVLSEENVQKRSIKQY